MSLIKKLLGNSSEDGVSRGRGKAAVTPPGLHTMGPSLQRKFAKGVQYNMKVVIRGDRNVGKTCLFHRLQGQKFVEEYLPTDEIQVASIQWNYKATDDVVKVEVWDVVDKGRKRKKKDGLKLTTDEDLLDDEPCLDADFVDVYKGTNGAILIYDITKQWTYDYVEKEFEKIPLNIPILVLGNHRDMGHHRTVLEDKARYFVENLDRPEGSGQVRYAEASMRNGFGLKYIHKFFNLPFLQLQRDTLLKQLEINHEDQLSMIEELNIHEESEEQNYDVFIEELSKQRREKQEAHGAQGSQTAPKAIAIPTKPTSFPNVSRSTSAPTIHKPAITPDASNSHTLPTPTVSSSNSVASTPVGEKDITEMLHTNQGKPPSPKPAERKSGFFSRLFNKQNNQQQTQTNQQKPDADAHTEPEVPVRSVEDFVPDSVGLDDSFLDDTKEVKDVAKKNIKETNSDSDDEVGGNPMVADFQDDLDSDDDVSPIKTAKIPADIDLSSEGEDSASFSGIVEDDHVTCDDDENPHRNVSVTKPIQTSTNTMATVNPLSSECEKDGNVKVPPSNISTDSLKNLDENEADIPVHTNESISSNKLATTDNTNQGFKKDSSSSNVMKTSDSMKSDQKTGPANGKASKYEDSDSESDDSVQVMVLQDEDINPKDFSKLGGLNDWLNQLEESSKKTSPLIESEEGRGDMKKIKKKSSRSEEGDNEGVEKEKKKKKKKRKEKDGSVSEKKKKKEKAKSDKESKAKDAEMKEKKKKQKKEEEEGMDDLEKFLAEDKSGSGMTYETL